MAILYIFLFISAGILVVSFFLTENITKQFASDWLIGKETWKREYVFYYISHKAPRGDSEMEQLISFLEKQKYVIYRKGSACVAHTPTSFKKRPFLIKITLDFGADSLNVYIRDAQFQCRMSVVGREQYRKAITRLCDEIMEVMRVTDREEIQVKSGVGPLIQIRNRRPVVNDNYKLL